MRLEALHQCANVNSLLARKRSLENRLDPCCGRERRWVKGTGSGSSTGNSHEMLRQSDAMGAVAFHRAGAGSFYVVLLCPPQHHRLCWSSDQGPDGPVRKSPIDLYPDPGLGFVAEIFLDALDVVLQVGALDRRQLDFAHARRFPFLDPPMLPAIARANDEAFTLQTELIELRRKVLGPGHPQTLMAMHYQACFEQGRNPELAIQLHRQVLAIRRKHFAPEHPEVIISVHYLGLACAQAGRYDEALQFREEVVALRR